MAVSGLGVIDHAAPFQDSIRVDATFFLFGYSPTATQERAPAHETAWSEFDSSWLRFGLGTIDHFVPSHDSIRVSCGKPPEVAYWPTAVHEDAETQDTAFRKFPFVPTSGLGTMVQEEPFQDSTSVWATVSLREP